MAHSLTAGALRVEVILAWRSRNYLAPTREPEAFRV